MLLSRLSLVTILCAAPLACNALFGVEDLSFQEPAAGGASSSTTSSGTGGGGAAGGTGGGAGAAGGTGGVGAGLDSYGYRRSLTITTSVSLPEAYSLVLPIDNQSWVQEGKARPDGADLRVVQLVDDEPVEIDRVLGPSSTWSATTTRLWFATQGPVGSAAESRYYLYYGQPNPQDAPQADGRAVFTIWEDFDEPVDEGWTFSEVGAASGSHEVSGGLLTLTSNGENIFDTADNFVFFHHPISGDFLARAHTVGAGGDLDDWANLGGVMVRASLAAASCNAVMSPTVSPVSVHFGYRLTDGGTTGYATAGNGMDLPKTVRLVRLGSAVTAAYQLGEWHSLGTESFGSDLPEQVLVGIPHTSNDPSMVGSAQVDWFVARKLVDPEPVVVLGDEESL